jgi:heterodisulfide reductase subunit A
VIFVRYEARRTRLWSRPPARGEVLHRSHQSAARGGGADCLLLSTGFVIADDEATEDLAAIFSSPHRRRLFWKTMSSSGRWTCPPGFFVAGTAHAPKRSGRALAQAQAAAGRAQTLLARDHQPGGGGGPGGRQKCAACLVCVRACPFGVPFINADGYSKSIRPSATAAVSAPPNARPRRFRFMQFEDDQIMAKTGGLLERMVA